MAHKIHTMDILPFRNSFQFSGCNIPSCCCKRFSEHLLLSQLLCYRGNLPRHHFITNTAAQAIDTGNILIFIKWHDAAAASHLKGKRSLFDRMSCEHTVMVVTPAINTTGKVLCIKDIHQMPIAKAETKGTITIYKQGTQLIQ